MYIENIIIGIPLVSESKLLAYSLTDWQQNEEKKTVYDKERFLPKLLVKYGFMKSTSEVKRNRPDLWITLDKPDFLELKIGKKKLWIVVGE